MLIYKILGNFVYLVARLIESTYRCEEKVGSLSQAKGYHPGGAHIFGIWHQNLVSSILSGNKFGPYGTLASASKDGEIIATAIKKFNLVPVRGSSKKGGLKAKNQMIEKIQEGLPFALTIDGPTGPAYEIKSGIIEIAQITGIPIVPHTALAKNYWVIKKSWDKMRIPKPFTKIYTYTGDPIWVPKDLPRERYNEIKEQIKKELFKEEEILNEIIKNS
jgi:lysophospholipid acyltransferase (LPLAT)-like uncharacterized protein